MAAAPNKKAYVESSNGWLHHEWINDHSFTSLAPRPQRYTPGNQRFPTSCPRVLKKNLPLRLSGT